ncbi:MAG TPA: TetR/AcrR family transcriptional regulator [Syntrophales bacterium]|nr:TetR/AcrR family transcriptional regulator [Syntrophales bacterium]
MGRNARFRNEDFIDAALKLASERGPAAVTVGAVAGVTGAPVGSVYHRFVSRDVIMAEVWLRVVASFQEGFLSLLKKGEGLKAALYTPEWVRSHPAEARVLILYRREELVAGDWPEGLKSKAHDVARSLNDGISEYAAKTFGKTGNRKLGEVVFAIVDVPYAAVMRYIRAGRKPPIVVDDLITKTYYAIMGRKK